MSKDKMTDAIGGIGDDLILEAKKNRSGIIILRRIAAAAACLVILIGIFLLYPKNNNSPTPTIMQSMPLPTTTVPSQAITPTTVPITSSTTIPTSDHALPSSTTTIPTISPTAPSSSLTKPPTAPTTSGLSKPPYSLSIKSEKEYNDLLLAAENEQLYQETFKYHMVFRSHIELIRFVNILKELPIPQIAEARSISMRYHPGNSEMDVEIVFEQTHFYRFTYFLAPTAKEDNLKMLSERNQILDTKVMVNEQRNISAITQFKIRWEGSPLYRCWMDIDGWLVMFEVRNDKVDLATQSITDVFAPIVFEKPIQFPDTANR